MILNILSAAIAFLFGVGMIYLLLDNTIGRLTILHSSFEWRGLQIKDFVFLAIAVGVILGFTSFYLPYR